MGVLKRTCEVVEVTIKANETISEPVTTHVGQSSWGGMELPLGAFAPNVVRLRVTINRDDYGPLPADDNTTGYMVLEGRAVLPIETFYFNGFRLEFETAPVTDTEIQICLRG